MGKKIDLQALRQQIQELPIDKELKHDLLEAISDKKRYGLVWEESEEEAQEIMQEYLPVFKEDESKRLDSAPEGSPNHVLIEGDNLNALTALTYTHAGKIDVIYIDPPYNRGDNDFIYNDKFIDKDNPFKHSLWLCFMSKRLRIAKKLLKDEGAIIMHVDEHEFDSLSVLLRNEIFGENCNLGVIVWNKMNPKGDAHTVAYMHEYVLLFCKNKEAFSTWTNTLMRKKPNAEKIITKAKNLFAKIGKSIVPDDVKKVVKLYQYSNDVMKELKVEYDYERISAEFKSWLNANNFSKGEKAYKYIDKNGDVFRTVSMAWPNKEEASPDYWIPLYHPITGEKCPLPSRGWRNPSKTMAKLLGDSEAFDYGDIVVKGEIAFTKKRNGECNIPERVYYLKDNLLENVPSIINDGSSSDKLLSDLHVSFPYPKSMAIATYLLGNIIRDKNLTILDFFAGSGTTLHATMQLNSEDGGHRQCILVTNNENGICEKVTYERNKRVIQGYTTPKGEQVPGLTNNNLRYYKTEFVPRENSVKNRRALMTSCIDLLCIKNNIYHEEETFGGRKFKKSVLRYFKDKAGQMLVVLDERVVSLIVPMIAEVATKENPLKVYVYSDGAYAYDDEFKEVLPFIELSALPAAFIQALESEDVLPEQKVKEEEIAEFNEEEMQEALHDTYNYVDKKGDNDND